MKKLQDEAVLLNHLLTLISTQLGPCAEIALYSLPGKSHASILDIRNGHITGRQVGDPVSDTELALLGVPASGGRQHCCVTTTQSGKTLRSIATTIANDNGKPIGAVTITSDITVTLQMESFLRCYNGVDSAAQSVEQLLEQLLQQAKNLAGKDPKTLTKQERVSFISFLDKNGAFKVTKSSNRVCDELGISKFTLYNDLDAIHGTVPEDSVP